MSQDHRPNIPGIPPRGTFKMHTLVLGVEPGSPASRTGLREGDSVVEFAGRSIVKPCVV